MDNSRRVQRNNWGRLLKICLHTKNPFRALKTSNESILTKNKNALNLILKRCFFAFFKNFTREEE